MRPQWLAIIVNLLGFKACWLVCVFAAAHGQAWISVLAITVWLCAHLARSPQPWREAALILVGAIPGAAWDVVSLRAGLISYQGSHAIAPGFVVTFLALWINFGTTIRVSFHWCWRRPIVAALMGAAGGPFAYWSGAQMGAIAFPADPLLSYLIVALQYGLALPLWFVAADRTLTPRSAP